MTSRSLAKLSSHRPAPQTRLPAVHSVFIPYSFLVHSHPHPLPVRSFALPHPSDPPLTLYRLRQRTRSWRRDPRLPGPHSRRRLDHHQVQQARDRLAPLGVPQEPRRPRRRPRRPVPHPFPRSCARRHPGVLEGDGGGQEARVGKEYWGEQVSRLRRLRRRRWGQGYGASALGFGPCESRQLRRGARHDPRASALGAVLTRALGWICWYWTLDARPRSSSVILHLRSVVCPGPNPFPSLSTYCSHPISSPPSFRSLPAFPFLSFPPLLSSRLRVPRPTVPAKPLASASRTSPPCSPHARSPPR